MNDSIKKLIEHQVISDISEETMCNDIGIVRKTYYNLKKNNTSPRKLTQKLIDNYLKESNVV